MVYSRSMKRFGGFVAAVALLVFGASASVHAASVDNFVISNYMVDMTLGTDTDGRSTLKTIETITAEFPNYDQNHGLERAIPQSYDGHTTSVNVISVTDGNDKAREYSTYSDNNGNLVVRMANMSTYVHGTQAYKLTYTQRDVTKYFADTNDDEFYWDINGVDWRVPIQNLSTTITLDNSLVAKQTGKTSCYQGYAGSTSTCDVQQYGAVLTNVASNLNSGQNVTIAIGFEPHTFVPYQKTLVEWWITSQIATGVVAAGILLWLIIAYTRASERRRHVGAIAPEYLPPSNASVTASARLLDKTKGSVMAAQLLDLAVRHKLRLYEVKPKTWYRLGEYEIEIVRGVQELRAEERELLEDMFGRTPVIGDRMNLKVLRNNFAYYSRTLDNDKKLKALIVDQYKLRWVDTAARARFRRYATVLLIVALLAFLSIPIAVVALLAYALAYSLQPLTDEGVALYRYLKGLDLYINVAEKERLQMLQSPEGAEKIVQVAKGTDQKSLVKLYECVLPYAVLFGREKQWTKQLGAYYEQTQAQPDWYVGRTAFNVAVFSSAMSGLSQVSSYAASSSSSSGGSGGGGSSGGGGGGGGGGGA